MKELLQDAVNAVRWLEREAVQDDGLPLLSRSFVERAKEVLRLLDAWAKYRKPARLGALVEGVNRLWRVGDLRRLLGTIPNRIMDPASRKNLLNIISKVARYQEAARFLYRIAKKVPLVRQMKIVLVTLPQNAFCKIPMNQCSPSFPSALSRIGTSYGQQWDVGQVCRLLKIGEAEANEHFAQQTRKTLKDGKIHAEMQLLFYCELEASRLPPRVFCSSKDACFLCNAFIRMYGKVHTPRCHGRLYPGWRLPFSPRFNDYERRFNTYTADRIRNGLMTLLSRQQKTAYPDPLESTLLTLPASVSTIRSLVLPEAEKDDFLLPQTLNGFGTDKTPLIPSHLKAISESSDGIASVGSVTWTAGAVVQPGNDITLQMLHCRGLSSESMTLGEQQQYHHPNRSVSLPLTSWSSGISAEPLARASVAPVRSHAGSSNEYAAQDPFQYTSLPLPPSSSLSEIDHIDSDRVSTPTPDHISLLTIEDKELPYSRLVSLTTPSLHMELGTLSLTFDFLQVLAGRLTVTHVEDDTALSRDNHMIEVENIPTKAELKMNCSYDLNELTFQLRSAHSGLICISFAWEEASSN